MNFKRFHESKNLFDGVIGTDNAIMTQIGNEQVNTNYALSDYISVEPSTTYTYSFNHKEYESTRKTFIITEYNTQKEVIFPIEGYNVKDSGLFSITFTTSSETRYILINWKKAQDENLMLNTGSTPLPYEPYSSEVWHDLTDHIMSTTWQDGSTYSRSGGSWSSSLTKKRSRKKK